MLRFVLSLAMVLGLGAGLASQAYAQASCQAEIVATGNGAILESAGPTKAIAAWRREVISRYGVFYGEPARANSGKGVTTYNCSRTLLGLMVCQARGTPCADASSAVEVTEIACGVAGDSRLCDPTVKWVQNRLNTKGYKLKVDGSAGPATAAAVRAFRRANGLADIAAIDDALIGKLRA